MFPRTVLSDSIAKRRKEYFVKGTMTGHWCYGPYFGANAKEPRTYGNAIYHPITEDSVLAPEDLHLIA
jgi:hypothetical protein